MGREVGEDLARADAGRYPAVMSVIVESSAPAPAGRPPLVSVEEYQRMPEFNDYGRRTELLRGVVVEKMPKTNLHVITAEDLCELARAAVDFGHFVRKGDPLTFVDSEPEPDVAIIPGSPADYRHEKPRTAALVMEVSINTLERDREKADLYAEAGIPEYWLVRPERGLIEVYTEPRHGLYTVRRTLSAVNGDTLTSATLPALRLDLKEFFAA